MYAYGCLSVSRICSRFTYHTGGHTGFFFFFKCEWAFFSKRIIAADRIRRARALITGVRVPQNGRVVRKSASICDFHKSKHDAVQWACRVG